jgi:hypothetical protein
MQVELERQVVDFLRSRFPFLPQPPITTNQSKAESARLAKSGHVLTPYDQAVEDASLS